MTPTNSIKRGGERIHRKNRLKQNKLLVLWDSILIGKKECKLYTISLLGCGEDQLR